MTNNQFSLACNKAMKILSKDRFVSIKIVFKNWSDAYDFEQHIFHKVYGTVDHYSSDRFYSFSVSEIEKGGIYNAMEFAGMMLSEAYSMKAVQIKCV